jgi:acyl carrier protein
MSDAGVRAKVEGIIVQCLKAMNQELQAPELTNPSLETSLFGPEGSLDSLGLVNLIADVEASVFEEFGKEVILADEKAISQENSPFESVQTLSAYVERLLSRETGD